MPSILEKICHALVAQSGNRWQRRRRRRVQRRSHPL